MKRILNIKKKILSCFTLKLIREDRLRTKIERSLNLFQTFPFYPFFLSDRREGGKKTHKV